MGILQSLAAILGGPSKKSVAPFQQTSNIPPQENYAGYDSLPNLPMSRGDFELDPYRLHAPFAVLRQKNRLVTNAGIHLFDAGDENVIRVPDQPLQEYFNQVKPLPPIEIVAPAHGVFVPPEKLQPGWRQTFVPAFTPHAAISGAAPPTLLSTPLVVNTIVDPGHRAPISRAKAPRPKRGQK